MQDTFVMLSERGHDVVWLEHLCMDQFEALAASSERLSARNRLTLISDGRQIAHADKKLAEYLRPLKAASKIPLTPEQTGSILKRAQQ